MAFVEIFPLLAALRTELCQLRAFSRALVRSPVSTNSLALIFKRALVVGVEFECLGVKGHGHLLDRRSCAGLNPRRL
jgi:hypothetical protein